MTVLLFAASKGIVVSIAQVLFFIVTILMIFAILLQEGKGGGLAALGGTRAEGVVGATNPIRRLTVVLAIMFFLLAGFITWSQKAQGLSGLTENQQQSSESMGESSEPGQSSEKQSAPGGATETTHTSPFSIPGQDESKEAAPLKEKQSKKEDVQAKPGDGTPATKSSK